MASGQAVERGVLVGSGIRLGHLFGVRIVIDWSLLIIFGLIAANLGLGLLPAWHPEWSVALIWGVSLVAAVLFFASILAHEMSHALVARAHGMKVERITLFIFGGLAQIEGESPTPRAELLVAGVGPVVSIVIGVVSILIGGALAEAPLTDDPVEFIASLGPVATLLLWLGPINVLLGVFNLISGFPLDGGRVLRAVLWWMTGSLRRATQLAARGGQAFAWLLMAVGVAMLFGAYIPVLGGGLVQGLWLLLIGWFLNNAARMSYQQLVIKEALDDVSVTEVMERDVHTIEPGLSVEELVRDHLMRRDQRAFPVVDGGRLVGLVTLADVRTVSREDWAATPVERIMTPAGELATLKPGDSAFDALTLLGQRNVDQIPIVEDGRLEGLVRRREIMTWLSLNPLAGRPERRDERPRNI